MRLHNYAPRPAHIKWLLDSDPAIRWQVMRDLTDEVPEVIAAERSRVATEGWGAELIARQSPAGHWGDGPNWDLITMYSLVALMDLGLDPASKQARKMIDRVDQVVELLAGGVALAHLRERDASPGAPSIIRQEDGDAFRG